MIMNKKQIIFYALIAIIVAFTINLIAVNVYAGDARIERITFDGKCVKIWVSSNEDDSRDKFLLRFQVRTSTRKIWGSRKYFRGLTTRTKYFEFCNSMHLRAKHCHVVAQIFHNRTLEDQYQWSGSPRLR
jgi:hypothetical protein